MKSSHRIQRRSEMTACHFHMISIWKTHIHTHTYTLSLTHTHAHVIHIVPYTHRATQNTHTHACTQWYNHTFISNLNINISVFTDNSKRKIGAEYQWIVVIFFYWTSRERFVRLCLYLYPVCVRATQCVCACISLSLAAASVWLVWFLSRKSQMFSF